MKWNRLSRNSILLQKSKGSTDSSDVHGVWSCSGESWSVLCLSGHDLSWEWELDLAVVELLNVGSSAVLGSDRFDLNNHDYHMIDHHVTVIVNNLHGGFGWILVVLCVWHPYLCKLGWRHQRCEWICIHGTCCEIQIVSRIWARLRSSWQRLVTFLEPSWQRQFHQRSCWPSCSMIQSTRIVTWQRLGLVRKVEPGKVVGLVERLSRGLTDLDGGSDKCPRYNHTHNRAMGIIQNLIATNPVLMAIYGQWSRIREDHLCTSF